MSSEQQQEAWGGQKGYFSVPRQLRIECMATGINTIKLVYFIADETLGWASHWALLSYSDILHGCAWHHGEGAGLPNDTAISRAIKEALERRLIEVHQSPAGTLYAIHRRFWVIAKLQPTWTLYKRLPYDATADPLTVEQAASIMIAQPFEQDQQNSTPAITMLAGSYQEDSKLLSPGKQPAITMIAATSDEIRPEAAPHVPNKVVEENRRNKTEKESVAAAPRSPDGSPLLSEEEGREEEEEEEQEEQPGLMTLRVEYTTLSHQLAQLDVNKQAGQWARLYKQVQAAEDHLRQAEQESSPSAAEPPACAKQQPEYAKLQAGQADRGEAALPQAEAAESGDRQAQLHAIASGLLYWKGGLKVLRMAQLPKWRGYFKWQIEAQIEALQQEYAKMRAEVAKPDG